MKKSKLFLGAIIATSMLSTHAFAQFTVGTEVRPRAEVRAGYKDLYIKDQNPNEILTHRVRLNSGFQTEKIKTFVSLQNVSVWGEQASSKGIRTTTNNDTSTFTSMCEGWAELNLSKMSALKLGRQQVSIEDERLLSTANWSQAGQMLDGALFHYDNDSVAKIRVFGSYNNDKDTKISSALTNTALNKKLKTFNFVEIKKVVNANLNFTLLGILSGALKPATTDHIYFKNTYGGYVTIKNEEISLIGSGFFQNGNSSNGKVTRAYLINTVLKYTQKKYEILAGLDYLSGNDMNNSDPNYTKYEHQFDVLLGQTRTFQGTMELVSPKITTAGIMNTYVKTKAKLDDKWSCALNYYFFKTQNNVGYTDASKQYVPLSKYLGQEADVFLNYKINSDVTFDFGYCYLYAAHTLKMIRSSSTAFDNQNWAWVQLTFKPKLFEGGLKN